LGSFSTILLSIFNINMTARYFWATC